MKKKNIILVIGIVMLLVFSGCSKDSGVENIITPDNFVKMASVERESDPDEGKTLLIMYKLEDNKRINQLGKILWGIENNMFSFVSQQAERVLKNKIEAVILMYNQNNTKGAAKILEKDILPILKGIFANIPSYVVVKSIIDAQLFLFLNPEISDDIAIVFKINIDIKFTVDINRLFDQIFGKAKMEDPEYNCPPNMIHAGPGGSAVIEEEYDPDTGELLNISGDVYDYCDCF